MTTSITTFLTYDTQAEDAAKLYTSLFDGTITSTARYPAGAPKPAGNAAPAPQAAAKSQEEKNAGEQDMLAQFLLDNLQ